MNIGSTLRTGFSAAISRQFSKFQKTQDAQFDPYERAPLLQNEVSANFEREERNKSTPKYKFNATERRDHALIGDIRAALYSAE